MLDVKQEEHSVRVLLGLRVEDASEGHFKLTVPTIEQTIDHYITYSVIASNPALTYSSVISTVRCFPVTSGKEEGSTYVQWSAHFSSDADAGMKSAVKKL